MAESWVRVEVGEVLAQTNIGHGDCLFVAISEQLEGQFSSLALRQMAVDYLTDHRAEFEEELLSLGWDMEELGEIGCHLEGDLLIDAVLQTLANPWTWGGAECIAAISLHLNREIRVYQENGPTIQFPGHEPAVRILLRYPRAGMQRRTHYESVLQWRARRPTANQSSSNVELHANTDASTQTVDPVPAAAPPTSHVETCSMPEASCQGQYGNRRRSDSVMVLRPRQAGLPSRNYFRSEEFSDEEEFQGNDNDAILSRCFMCRRNIGRYALLNCGKFPACGSCIRTWYVNIKEVQVPCPHCGAIVAGWTKVFNQN